MIRFRASALAISAFAALAGLGLGGCDFGQAKPQAAAPAAPKVTASAPTIRTITEWDEYTGRFAAVESVEVRARVSGYLTAIHFKDGQLVKPGDPLFTIDKRTFETAVTSAEADVKVAEATLDFARQELGRAKALRPTDAVPERVVEERSSNVRQGEARVLAAKAVLERARLDLEFTDVRAPVAGRIDNHRVSVGNLISGGNGGDTDATLLTTIVSLDPIHVVFDVDQAAYLRYVRGALDGTRASPRDGANPVRIGLPDDKDYPYEGQLDFVSNQVDRASATVRARAVLGNQNLMFAPGLFARVHLAGRNAYEAVMIPDEAIATDQASRVVYVVKDGKAEMRTVTPGPIVDGLRVIRAGLSRDDMVVTSGLQRIRPGQEVAVDNGVGDKMKTADADGAPKSHEGRAQ
ncbi:MAG: efflux RND transporter periplasmic adaptor subunit [Hyphomicrobium sp.]